MPIDPYAIVPIETRDGKQIDALTDGALKRAEKRLGRKIPIVQGSYNVGVVQSAGTHDEGGVFDTKAWDVDATVTALRAVGFAAWYRPTLPGHWEAHIHAVLIGHGRLAPVAARQVSAYLARRDGLAGNGPDVDPGWTNTVRYTVESLKADIIRAELRERIDGKRVERQTLRRQIARLVEKLKALPK